MRYMSPSGGRCQVRPRIHSCQWWQEQKILDRLANFTLHSQTALVLCCPQCLSICALIYKSFSLFVCCLQFCLCLCKCVACLLEPLQKACYNLIIFALVLCWLGIGDNWLCALSDALLSHNSSNKKSSLPLFSFFFQPCQWCLSQITIARL